MVIEAFALVGIIIILGFIGDYLFKKTSIPDILILILFGFLLGPIFNIIDPAVLSPIAPFLASLALLIILFDAGLNLNLRRVLRESSRAFLLGVLSFLTSMIFTTFLAYYIWNWSWMYSLLLGAIIGGTSSSVVIPLISRMKLSPRVTTLLSLESAITDAIVVVVGIAILHVITVSPGGNELTTIAHSITSAFSIGATFGLITGIIWLRILKNIEHGIYDDIITLSFVLLLFAIVESLGGNGAIFALAFGLVLGNGREISDMLNIKEPMEAGRMMKKFMSQISFFIRTFFFMYLGLMLIIKNYHLIFYGILISVILLFGRLISSYFASFGDALLEKNRSIMTIILPRGLAAAVLSQLIVTSNVSKGYMFSDIIIIVIIITVVISSIGSSIIEKGMKSAIDEKEKTNN